MIDNLYIASCTEQGGIYHYNIDCNGKVKLINKTACNKPMYMTVFKEKLYVLLRSPFENDASGLITMEIDKDASLFDPSSPVSTLGQVACHLAVNDNGIYVANYISSNVTKLPDKSVYHKGHGPNQIRQTVAHPHFVTVTPDNKYICVCDLGIDAVIIYDWELNEKSRVNVPEGHGVRHLVFSDDGQYAFSANEIMSTVTAFAYKDATLRYIDTISGINKENLCSTSAAIRYSNGYIYVSNRGNNTISKLTFDKGKLEFLNEYPTFGDSPRDFIIHNEYIICTNELSDTVTVLCEKDNKVSLVNEINVERPLCALIM